MPIQAPQFNVPALSPSALLSGRDRDNNPFQGIMNQVLNFALNKRLVEDRTQAQQQGATERALSRDIAAGRLTREGDLDDITLPGEDFSSIPRIEGVGSFEGETFVPTTAVQRLEQRQVGAQEVDALGGRETFEGTTVSDVFGPPGTGTPSSEQVERNIVGDQEFVLGRLEAARQNAPDAGTRQFIESLQERVRSDERFSLAEQREIVDEVSPGVVRQFGETSRAIREADRERQEEVAGFMQEGANNLEVVASDGTGRPMTAAQRQIYGLGRSGNFDLAQDPEAARQAFETLQGQLRPRPTATDIREDLNRLFTAPLTTGNNEHTQFINWMRSLYRNADGQVINQEIAADVRDVAGETSDSGLRAFATTRSPTTADYRAAFALESRGLHTLSDVQKNLSDVGVVPPFGLSAVKRAYRKIDPSWFDVPEANVDNSAVGSEPQPGGGGEGTGGGGGGGGTEIDFGASRQNMADTINARVQRGGDQARENLAREVLTILGDRDEIVQLYRQTARQTRELAQSDRTTDEQARQLREQAEQYERRADDAEQNWEQFKVERDSIFLPAVRQTGALDGILDLDNLDR